MIEITLWTLAGLVVYSYAGYPLVLASIAALRPRTVSTSPVRPSITVIIAAYNEEKDIARKLGAVLEQDYPADRRKVIVTSDCSTDRTHEIVRTFADRGVELVVLPERAGKTAAQNLAVTKARGEILVFTDATTELADGAFVKLVEPFSDPSIGCTGAQLEYRSDAGSAVGHGGGLYWRYEKRVKELESRANSLIGVSGCLYAVRRSIYQPIAPDLISDLVIALDVCERGCVSHYVPEAVAYELTNEEASPEFRMRSRVVVRSINALVQRRRLLNPFRSGLFAFQLLSHKVLRYLVPVFLLGFALLSVWLALAPGPRAGLYQMLVALQLLGYAGVPSAYLLCRRLGLPTSILSAPFYFILANAAAFWAIASFLRGNRAVTWMTVR